jgi:DNA-binding response OmpR family regulator
MMCSRCAELEERVAWLEGELGLRTAAAARHALCRAFKITPGEAAMLATLHAAKGKFVSTWLLLDTTAPSRDDRSPNSVSVRIYWLRAKLGKGAIETVYGAGYRLSEPGQALVAAVLASAEAAA